MEVITQLTDQEKRKNSNKNYYMKNRAIVLEKIKVKQSCELCNKVITACNMLRHQKSSACINNGCVKVSKKDKIAEIQNKINELENLVKNKIGT